MPPPAAPPPPAPPATDHATGGGYGRATRRWRGLGKGLVVAGPTLAALALPLLSGPLPLAGPLAWLKLGRVDLHLLMLEAGLLWQLAVILVAVGTLLLWTDGR